MGYVAINRICYLHKLTYLKIWKIQKRKNTHSNLLHPTNSTATPSGEYDIYPAFPLGKGKIGKGINQLADWIEKHSQIKIDGYIGVFWDELIIKLGEELRKRGRMCDSFIPV